MEWKDIRAMWRRVKMTQTMSLGTWLIPRVNSLLANEQNETKKKKKTHRISNTLHTHFRHLVIFISCGRSWIQALWDKNTRLAIGGFLHRFFYLFFNVYLNKHTNICLSHNESPRPREMNAAIWISLQIRVKEKMSKNRHCRPDNPISHRL